MFKKIFANIAITLIAAAVLAVPVAAAGKSNRESKTPEVAGAKFDLSAWVIESESSRWNDAEKETVQAILIHSIEALDTAGIDGQSVFEGYRFRRWDGAFAKDKDGKIAVVNHSDREIVLGDVVMLPENHFFIYHELGHIVNLRTNDRLSANFHAETEKIEGIVILHDWTTAMGFWMRGQSHVKRSEATADAFALWVLVGFMGSQAPTFQDTPESAQPDAIVNLFNAVLPVSFTN